MRAADPSVCVRDASEARRLARQHVYHWLTVQSTLDSAACLNVVQPGSQALNLIRQARSAARTYSFPSLELRALSFEAETLHFMGQRQQALLAAAAGLDLVFEGSYPIARPTNFYATQMRAAEATGHWHLSAILGRQIAALLAAQNRPLQQAIVLLRVAEASERVGRVAEASASLAQAERLFANAPQSATTRAWKLYGTWTLSRIDRRARPLPVDDALDAASHLGSGGRSGLLRAVAASLWSSGNASEAERLLRRLLAAPAFRKPPTVSELRALRAEQDDARRLLTEVLLSGGRHRDALAAALAPHHPASPDPASAIADRIGDRTAYSFRQLGSRVGRFTINRRGVRFQWLAAGPDSIAREVRRLRRAGSANDPETARIGAHLFQLLFRGEVPPQRTVVDWDPALPMPAWGVLRDPGGQWLAQTRLVAVVPGLAIGPPSPLQPQPSLLVAHSPQAPPRWADWFPSLRAVGDEVAPLLRSWPDATLLSGPPLTVDQLTRSLSAFEALHYSGHAVELPGETALLLPAPPTSRDWSDGVWTVGPLKVGSLDNLKVVMLAACSTASENGGIGGESGSIPLGLIEAGVESVVGTAWDIPAGSTGPWSDDFFEAWRTSRDPATAFDQALRGLVAREGTGRPSGWGGFVLYRRLL